MGSEALTGDELSDKRRWRPGAPLLASTLAIAALALASCGGDEEEPEPAATSAEEASEPAPSGGAAEEGDAVEIADFKYAPEAISASVGSEIVFTNSDSAPHTATADDGSFDTGRLAQDDEGSITVEEAGEFSYFCDFHPFMKGTVEVTE